jgi:archaellum biogenesis ATPase FlaH
MQRKISSGVLSDDDRNEIDRSINETRLEASLACFKASNGLRPGQLSVMLGPKGNGKSALSKTISFDAMKDRKKCLHILSEEQSSIYKSKLAFKVEETLGARSGDLLSYLLYDSMLDWPKEQLTLKGFFTNLYQTINELQPEIVIFDNFTTSFIGDLPIQQQGEAVKALRNMAAKFDIILVCIMHTVKGTDVYKQILSGEDVRGNSSSTNTSAYNYVLSTYFRSEIPRAILFIDKARYHPDLNQTYWELFYDKESGIYVKDEKVSYETVKMIMAEGKMGNSIDKLIESKLDKILKGRGNG